MARRRPQAAGRRRLRRRRLRRAVQGAAPRRRRARRLPGPPHRPDRAPRGRPRRGRDGRRRRGRPHGRHGLPARGPGAARPHARRPARRCCSRPRSTARSTASSSATSATRRATCCPRPTSARPPTASGRSTAPTRVDVTAEIVDAAGPTIVFCRTKHGADALAKKLDQRGVRSAAIHGNRSQGQRERALAAFADGKVPRARRHRRRRPRHPRRRRRLRGPLRPAGRLQGLHAPLRPHRARRRRGHRRVAGRRPTSEGWWRASSASWASVPACARPDITLDRPPARRSKSRSAPDADAVAAVMPRPRRRPATDGRPSGTIKWFDAARASASSSVEGGATCSCTSPPSRATDTAASRRASTVEFEVAPGRKGEQAQRVRVLVGS